MLLISRIWNCSFIKDHLSYSVGFLTSYGIPKLSKLGATSTASIEEPKDIWDTGMGLARMTQGHWEICASVAAGSQAEYNGESKMAPGAYVWTSEPSPSAWNSIQVRDGQLSWQCFTQLPLRVWHRIWERRPLCFAVDINQHRIHPLILPAEKQGMNIAFPVYFGIMRPLCHLLKAAWEGPA